MSQTWITENRENQDVPETSLTIMKTKTCYRRGSLTIVKTKTCHRRGSLTIMPLIEFFVFGTEIGAC